MKGKTDVVRLLRIAAVLLLVYVVILAAIDYILHFPSPMRWPLYLFDVGMPPKPTPRKPEYFWCPIRRGCRKGRFAGSAVNVARVL